LLGRLCGQLRKSKKQANLGFSYTRLCHTYGTRSCPLPTLGVTAMSSLTELVVSQRLSIPKP
jgi:hypothetical protein